MKSVIVDRKLRKSPVPLRMEDDDQTLDEVALNSGEVHIEVIAAGVSRLDHIRLYSGSHRYFDKQIPGMELVGRVKRIHEDATGVYPGDAVMAFPMEGAFASEAIVHCHQCVVLPNDIDPVSVAAFPISYGAAWTGLVHRAQLRTDQTILVLDADSPQGQAVVDLASSLRANVIALVRNGGFANKLEQMGANEIINPEEGDVVEILKSLKQSVDMVIAPMGSHVGHRVFDCIRSCGKLLLLDTGGGVSFDVRLEEALSSNVDMLACDWRRTLEQDQELQTRCFHELMSMIRDQLIIPKPDHVMSLEDAANALQLYKENDCVGKIVLRV